jgi:protein TonB
MVRICLIICIAFHANCVFSQVDSIEYAEKDSIEEVGHTSEYMPIYQLGSYEGNLMTIHSFFSEFIEYPLEHCDSIRKYVLIQFNVETNGKIRDIKVLKGLNAEMDKEAVRVVKLIKCIRPAYTRGKPVKYREVIPIIFYKIPRKW